MNRSLAASQPTGRRERRPTRAPCPPAASRGGTTDRPTGTTPDANARLARRTARRERPTSRRTRRPTRAHRPPAAPRDGKTIPTGTKPNATTRRTHHPPRRHGRRVVEHEAHPEHTACPPHRSAATAEGHEARDHRRATHSPHRGGTANKSHLRTRSGQRLQNSPPERRDKRSPSLSPERQKNDSKFHLRTHRADGQQADGREAQRELTTHPPHRAAARFPNLTRLTRKHRAALSRHSPGQSHPGHPRNPARPGH